MKHHPTLPLLLAIAGSASATPVSVSGPGVITQNFDSLPAATQAWTNDTTLSGWYVQINNADWAGTFQVTDGSGTAINGLLNLGTTGSTDRALGSKATSTATSANIAYGVVLQNTAAVPLTLSNISFNFELWRVNAGTGTPPVEVKEELYVFATPPGATAVTTILSGAGNTTGAAGAGFAAVGTNPIVHTVSSPLTAVLVGNTAPNSQPVSINSNILMAPGQFVTLKFTDTNEAGTDGYQGIDDLALTFTAPVDCTLSSSGASTVRQTGALPEDPADDTVDITFTVDGTGTQRSTDWVISAPAGSSLAGATGTYGTPFTRTGVPIAEFAAGLTLTAADSVHASCTTPVALRVTGVLGTSTLSGSPQPIYTDGLPDAAWVINDASRTADMTTGGAGDKIASTTLIDLSAAGSVLFTAKFRARETSASTNFEAGDMFKAVLEYSIGGTDQTPINLISAWDDGDGAASAGDNGAPNGYLNGFSGVDPDGTGALVAEDNYNDFRVRDELNHLSEIADTQTDNTFSLSAHLPASADNVRLRIYGTGIAGSEFFTVSNVLFAADSDEDGIPDHYETAQNLDPQSPADRDLDLDGDGQSNLNEFLAGTAANDPLSVFAASIIVTGATTARVEFPSVTGKSYRLQSSADLTTGTWMPEGGPVAGTGAPLSFNTTITGLRRFVRVSIQ